MVYSDLQHLSAAEFKRLCGVSRNTFSEMALGVTTAFGTSWSARWTEQTEC